MIESPMLRELLAENTRDTILTVLVARFGGQAKTLQEQLDPIASGKRLKEMAKQAATCPDLHSFKKLLEP